MIKEKITSDELGSQVWEASTKAQPVTQLTLFQVMTETAAMGWVYVSDEARVEPLEKAD